MYQLYYKDAYIREFETEVKAVNKGKFIVLDQTIFYPNGGGQPHDMGKIISNGREYNIIYVGKFDGMISHEVDKEGLKVGDKIKGVLNWERRYKYMRMHTAVHIVCQIINSETGALITGNQIGEHKTRVDFSLEDYDKEKIREYVERSNEIVNKNLDVRSYFISKEEAQKIPDLIKLAMKLPDREEIRIVEIGDFDRQADGGTHVKNTEEIGKVVFLKTDNKGKNNRRVYFSL